MLLILQITQLDYGDAALCALSALRGRAEDPGSAASRQEQLAARLLQSASGRAAALIEEEAAKRGLRLKLGRLSVSAGWSA